MTTATRVGLLVTPRSLRQVICWRCGIEFDANAQNVVRTAPCRDCRDVLRAEGCTEVWNSRLVVAA